jgi:DeoR family transcriptional regulator, catabolite repression regulator
MAINDRHLRILRSIAAGNTTGESLVDDLGSSMQMLTHFLNIMVEDGYVKAARVYDNDLRDFIVVKAYLTPEGQALLQTHTPPAETPAETPVETPVETPTNLNLPIITQALAAIHQLIPELPQDWRELTEVYFNDLFAELTQSDRRRPIQIKAYFLSLLRSILPLLPKLPEREAWTTQAQILSKELGLPIRLPGNN